jgi:uncharacterized Zn finger protein (UPF0148 family)
MSSSEDKISKIKAAASLLVKGGTLTSEPCQKCSGVQVRFGDKITCINCGNVIDAGDARPKVEPDKTPVHGSAHLTSAASLIEEKIALLASEIRLENDVLMQRQKARLLETYLRILEKTKSLIG